MHVLTFLFLNIPDCDGTSIATHIQVFLIVAEGTADNLSKDAIVLLQRLKLGKTPYIKAAIVIAGGHQVGVCSYRSTFEGLTSRCRLELLKSSHCQPNNT